MKKFKFEINEETEIVMNRTIKRKIDIEENTNRNFHKVHKNKKAYSRKDKFGDNYLS